jgi:Tol biopolymer transport system component
MRLVLFIAILLLSHAQISSQECGKISNEEKYFGLTPPGSTPEIFAPDIISTEEFEFSGTFSPDGSEYFFTRRPTYEGSANRIYYSRFDNNKWTVPELAPFAMDQFEFEPVMSPDGEKIYFYSERNDNRDSRYDGDLWISKKTSAGWGEAAYFLSPVNKKWCMSVCPSNSGTLYFSSNYNGKRGVFISKLVSGEYPDVQYLGEGINNLGFSHPYIAPDESYLIMDAQPTGRGKSELFVSFKKEDGSWSTPVNLGSEINATKTEFGGSISPDGKYLFFHRRHNGNGDIYWVNANVINKFKPDEIK